MMFLMDIISLFSYFLPFLSRAFIKRNIYLNDFLNLNVETRKTEIMPLKTCEDTPLLFHAVHFFRWAENFTAFFNYFILV